MSWQTLREHIEKNHRLARIAQATDEEWRATQGIVWADLLLPGPLQGEGNQIAT